MQREQTVRGAGDAGATAPLGEGIVEFAAWAGAKEARNVAAKAAQKKRSVFIGKGDKNTTSEALRGAQALDSKEGEGFAKDASSKASLCDLCG
jgi:hypothetical protein